MSCCACGSHRAAFRSHSLLPRVPKARTRVFRFARQLLFLLLTQFPHGDGDQTQGLELGKCLPCCEAAYPCPSFFFNFIYLLPLFLKFYLFILLFLAVSFTSIYDSGGGYLHKAST